MGRPPAPIKMVTPYALRLSWCLYKPEQKFQLLYVIIYVIIYASRSSPRGGRLQAVIDQAPQLKVHGAIARP
jgi:hypothetical protein